MTKTIFYKKSNDDTGDYWFDNRPYNEWFVLDNTLYEPNGSIVKKTRNSNNFLRSVSFSCVEDTFSDEGIIRRIQLYISE